ncbi:histidine phosphatase family protein [Bradyrhizobium sp. ISRA443]|uniref:histidine phosphatase family protein n=1 Tax=unclassified Bradyrhizobium TaxID=2631580 RepID=UPI00247A4AAA|nr:MULTISPECIES: histidine phosphatase family protein [unclassified Bradyrhizobium]WGR91830.1 histidine phosphatase family protein [Bradyrhizobium sp. ISRA435]WGS02196.1 histidine phosphatase family protein [Bradyrhizobium sp. ISRA436]WGS09081.1 histidine phosphatase family protein [Bradyrhizobium sp. ISRA437]WGS15970.1 histidine phosphatase family protein [Bradyrhizobium sp. ISRA443]
MTKILLVRHGHVEGIRPPRFRGREDLPLTPRGKVEALAVARHIASKWQPARVYTSPLSRCVETGTAIARACGVEVERIDQLNDIDYGAWRMRSHEEMAAAEPVLFATWFTSPHLMRFPGGDSMQDLVSRSADAMRIAHERHPDQTVVLVSHDSVNRALLVQLADLPLSSYWRLTQTPCCVNEIDVTGTQIQIRGINDTSHLKDIETV